ncbi:LPXTG cell wall anchor domain-containing protein, partial [Pediococcus argentinicus]
PPTVPTTPPTVPTTPPTVPTTPPTVPTTPPTVPTTPPTVPTTPPTAPAKQLNKKLPQTGEDSDDGILLIIGELLGAIGLLGALKKKKN